MSARFSSASRDTCSSMVGSETVCQQKCADLGMLNFVLFKVIFAAADMFYSSVRQNDFHHSVAGNLYIHDCAVCLPPEAGNFALFTQAASLCMGYRHIKVGCDPNFGKTGGSILNTGRMDSFGG